MQKFGQIPRFKACMDWAESSNLLDAAKQEENYTLYECIPRFVINFHLRGHLSTEVDTNR